LSEQQTWWERKIEQRGGDVAAYHGLIRQIEGLLRAEGTLGRSDLRAATDLPLTDWHLSSWGGIFVDLIWCAKGTLAMRLERAARGALPTASIGGSEGNLRGTRQNS
jgi:hypothetical protein